MRKLVNHLLKTKQRTENDSVSNDNKTESASTERPPETHYYLFELGFSVVKQEGLYWYGRDRKNHKWSINMDWMRRFYDVGYDVVEIDYDEERESITGIRPVYEFGYPYDWLKEALDDKSYEMPSASTIKPLDSGKKEQQRNDSFSIIKGYRKNENSYVFYQDKELLCAIDVQPSCFLPVIIVGRKRVLALVTGDLADSERMLIRGLGDWEDIFEAAVSDERVKEVCFANEDGQILKEKRWDILEEDSLLMVYNKAQGMQERSETLQVASITRNAIKNQGFTANSERWRDKSYCDVTLYVSDVSEEELFAVLLLPVLADVRCKSALHRESSQNVHRNQLPGCISSGIWGAKFERRLRAEINRIKIQKDHRYEKLIRYWECWFVPCVECLVKGAEAGEADMLYLAAEAISYFDKNAWIMYTKHEEFLFSRKAAHELYIQSADKGFPHAMLWCAFCFAEGRGGFPASSERSVWYLKAYFDSKDKINSIILPDLLFLKEEALEIMHMICEAERDENAIAMENGFDYQTCYEQLPDPGEESLSDRLEILNEFMIGMGLPYVFDGDKIGRFTAEADKIKQIKSQWQAWCKNQGIILKME